MVREVKGNYSTAPDGVNWGVYEVAGMGALEIIDRPAPPAPIEEAPPAPVEREAGPSVWTWAANPWQEQLLATERDAEAPPRPRSRFSRVLAWLIEYNRY